LSELDNAVLVSNDPADTPAEAKPEPSADAAAEGAESKPEAEDASEPEPETGEAEQESDDEAPKQPKKKGGFQKRIDQLTREKADLERRLAENSAAKPSQQQNTPAQQPPAGKPDAAKFDSYEAYVEALADWKLDQRETARKAEADKKAAAEAADAANKTWKERVDKTRELHADFDEVIASGATLPVSQALHTAILESDRGPELAYYLAANPAEAKRINGLSPFAQVRELGKIEATKLSTDNAPAQPEAKVSKAPEPISPVGKRPARTAAVKPDEMSFQEYNAWREKEIAKRGGRR
jgi:hypothetical protein